MKRPAFQFYPGDWIRDAHLRICSSAARGLWIDMMALMHQAEPYGYLVFNGKPIDPAQLAKMVGEAPRDVTRWLAELEAAGVPSRDDQGRLYSRRMVRDERTRSARANGGAKGAEHGDKGGLFGPLGGRPKGGSETPLDPPHVTPPFRAEGEEGVRDSASRTTPIPPWVDSYLWEDFLGMRVKIRKPATDRAKVLIIRELEKLRTKGFDANAVLEQSIRNSWQDVYALKETAGTLDAWWTSDEGISRKGRELGMSARPGETTASYRDRIKQRIEDARKTS